MWEFCGGWGSERVFARPTPRLAAHRPHKRTKWRFALSGMGRCPLPRVGQLISWLATSARRASFTAARDSGAQRPLLQPSNLGERGNAPPLPRREAPSCAFVFRRGPRWRASRSAGLEGSARQRASTSDFVQLSERRERSEHSEFCTMPSRPSTAVCPAESWTARPGSPFFAYFLWRSKDSRSPVGASPDAVPRQWKESPNPTQSVPCGNTNIARVLPLPTVAVDLAVLPFSDASMR